MKKASHYGAILDAAERLTLDEQESLAEVLKNRAVEQRRALLAREVAAARREHAAGKSKRSSVKSLMRDITR